MNKDTSQELGSHTYKGGVKFGVWAPFASSVALTGTFNNWSHTPMVSDGNGFWFIKYEGAVAGQEYKYVIQNGDKQLFKNDPRSSATTH